MFINLGNEEEKKAFADALVDMAKNAGAVETEAAPFTTDDGALLEQPANVVLFHRGTTLHPMEYLDNSITVMMNNFILTYGKERVFQALAFHYKLKPETK